MTIRTVPAASSLTLALLLLLLGPSPTTEYSMGAPDSACNRMMPGHGFDPQTGEPPARLVLEKDTVAPGQTLKFRIEGGEFKGFIVQARVDPDENAQVGVGASDLSRSSHEVIVGRKDRDRRSLELYHSKPCSCLSRSAPSRARTPTT